jgi:hypothetical protein
VTVDVRRAVLHRLGVGETSRFGRPYLVGTVGQATGCAETGVWEALWSVVGDGLVYLDTADQGSGTDNWQWRLSADGKRVAEGATWEPRDPDGYLARARRESPELDGRIEPVRPDLPDGLADSLALDAIADLIRLTRNEVGHPTGRRIDEDTGRVHLAIAPMYLRKMRQVAARFAHVSAEAGA